MALTLSTSSALGAMGHGANVLHPVSLAGVPVGTAHICAVSSSLVKDDADGWFSGAADQCSACVISSQHTRPTRGRSHMRRAFGT
eukprot:6443809-Prymnesium_polylepis.1